VALLKEAEDVKQPSASVNPDSQALSKVTFLLHSMNVISVLYLLLKAFRKSLN